jgi:shikimate kinase
MPVNKRSDRIFLIGFMASGKSTIGPILANAMGYKFLDTDLLFEKKEKVSIREFILNNGEKEFRLKETQLLKSLANEKRCIISTGGGMPCFNKNMDFMNEIGLTVFLKTGINTIYDRVHNDKNRPIAFGKSKKDLEYIYIGRKEYYEKSLIQVLSNRSPVKVVKRIIKLLSL